MTVGKTDKNIRGKVDMRKWIITLSVLGTMFLFIGCGGNINGNYIGEDGGTLEISAGKFSYFEEGWFEDFSLSGDCSKQDSDTYVLEGDDVTLYADIEDNDKLYVYSNDSRWRSEYFRKTN